MHGDIMGIGEELRRCCRHCEIDCSYGRVRFQELDDGGCSQSDDESITHDHELIKLVMRFDSRTWPQMLDKLIWIAPFPFSQLSPPKSASSTPFAYIEAAILSETALVVRTDLQFRHLRRTKILQLPNSEIGFTNPLFNSDHPTSIRTTQLVTSASATQLQLRQRNFNFANATSTSPLQLQLHQCNFNLGKTKSTSLMQLQLCTVNLNFKFELQFWPSSTGAAPHPHVWWPVALLADLAPRFSE